MIKSVQEFLDKLKEINQSNNVELYFRGETKDRGETANIPSIFRKDNWIENEHKIFREFILRNPNEFKDDKTVFDKLVRMQHYGLPTRLLDVSSNALMSLYFACENYQDKEDGIVSIFKIPKDKIEFYDSKKVSVISNIAVSKPKIFESILPESSYNNYTQYLEKLDKYINQFQNNINLENKKLADKSWGNIKILESTLNNQVQSFIESSNIPKEHLDIDAINIYGNIGNIRLVKPLLSNKRIIMQSGAFIIFGLDINQDNKLFPAILQFATTKIKIDRCYKKSILKQLATLGISQDKVYPEMDSVAEYLKEIYK